MGTPGRAAIYARISDDREGEARGVDRQIEDCRAKAAALNLEVIEPPFVDNDISASSKSKKARPAYDEMLSRARNGEFGTILAYSNSRITRRPLELEELIQLSTVYGTMIRTVVSGDDDLSLTEGQMVARIKAAVDAAESDKVADRVKRRVDQRKQAGEYHGSVAPFGFSVVPKEKRSGQDLVHDPREVEMIREATTRLLDASDSVYSIVRDWNRLGKRTRTGTPWRQGVLRKALTNPALIAKTRPIVPSGQRASIASEGYPARWEPILDEATYRALYDRLIDPARSHYGVHKTGPKSSKYALAGGLTVCGRCGKALYGVARKDQPTKLVCKASINGEHENHPIRDDGTSEGRVTVNYAALEEHVFNEFVAHLNDMPYWQAHKHDPDPEANEKIAELERAKDAEEAKIRRAEEQAFDGLIDPKRLREMIDSARARVRELDTQIADLKGTPSRRDNVLASFGTPEWILDQRDKFPSDVKRTLLKLMIERVIISDWPADLPKTASLRGDETPEAFEARREALWAEGMARRVEIGWRS